MNPSHKRGVHSGEQPHCVKHLYPSETRSTARFSPVGTAVRCGLGWCDDTAPFSCCHSHTWRYPLFGNNTPTMLGLLSQPFVGGLSSTASMMQSVIEMPSRFARFCMYCFSSGEIRSDSVWVLFLFLGMIVPSCDDVTTVTTDIPPHGICKRKPQCFQRL